MGREKSERTKMRNDSDVLSTMPPNPSGLTKAQFLAYFKDSDNWSMLSEQTGNTFLDYVYVLRNHFARVDGNSSTGVTKKYMLDKGQVNMVKNKDGIED